MIPAEIKIMYFVSVMRSRRKMKLRELPRQIVKQLLAAVFATSDFVSSLLFILDIFMTLVS
jgi:hypothetical protein